MSEQKKEKSGTPFIAWVAVIGILLIVLIGVFLNYGGRQIHAVIDEPESATPAGLSGERFPASAGWSVERTADSCTIRFPTDSSEAERDAYNEQECVAHGFTNRPADPSVQERAAPDNRFPASAGWRVERLSTHCTIHFPMSSTRAERAEYHRLMCVEYGYGRDGHEGPANL